MTTLPKHYCCKNKRRRSYYEIYSRSIERWQGWQETSIVIIKCIRGHNSWLHCLSTIEIKIGDEGPCINFYWRSELIVYSTNIYEYNVVSWRKQYQAIMHKRTGDESILWWWWWFDRDILEEIVYNYYCTIQPVSWYFNHDY